VFSRLGGKVDLVITDLVMPQMSGRELIENLRQLSPGLRILCASGFIHPKPNPYKGFYLKKPFTSQQLLSKVKQIFS
ncbi:MAG: response regulator, partial [Verrucomicrobia bacterium]|nr:response regulator [Verrucomicrobiota bacterium]